MLGISDSTATSQERGSAEQAGGGGRLAAGFGVVAGAEFGGGQVDERQDAGAPRGVRELVERGGEALAGRGVGGGFQVQVAGYGGEVGGGVVGDGGRVLTIGTTVMGMREAIASQSRPAA